jgi:hypothetical protein
MVSTFWITIILLKNCVRLKFSVRAFLHMSSKDTFQGAPQSKYMLVEAVIFSIMQHIFNPDFEYI